MSGRCNMYWGNKLYKIFIKKPERKRPLVRPRHIWDDKIKMHLRKMGCKVVKLQAKLN
jgi:hypothetical protein